MPYEVMVDDNFHYMDESERYRVGEFADAAAAIERCRRIVDEYLDSARKPGMSADALWDSYVSFGEDPFIRSVNADPVRFSSWNYARERCAETCPEAAPGALPQ